MCHTPTFWRGVQASGTVSGTGVQMVRLIGTGAKWYKTVGMSCGLRYHEAAVYELFGERGSRSQIQPSSSVVMLWGYTVLAGTRSRRQAVAGM